MLIYQLPNPYVQQHAGVEELSGTLLLNNLSDQQVESNQAGSWHFDQQVESDQAGSWHFDQQLEWDQAWS